MNVPTIVIGSYLAIGGIVALVIGFSDFNKKRVSVTRLVSELAYLGQVAFLIWVVLWPIWIAMLLFESRRRRIDVVETNEIIDTTTKPKNDA